MVPANKNLVTDFPQETLQDNALHKVLEAQAVAAGVQVARLPSAVQENEQLALPLECARQQATLRLQTLRQPLRPPMQFESPQMPKQP